MIFDVYTDTCSVNTNLYSSLLTSKSRSHLSCYFFISQKTLVYVPIRDLQSYKFLHVLLLDSQLIPFLFLTPSSFNIRLHFVLHIFRLPFCLSLSCLSVFSSTQFKIKFLFFFLVDIFPNMVPGFYFPFFVLS